MTPHYVGLPCPVVLWGRSPKGDLSGRSRRRRLKPQARRAKSEADGEDSNPACPAVISAFPPGPPPARRPEPYGSESRSRPLWLPAPLPARRASRPEGRAQSLQLGEAGGRIFSRGIVQPYRTTTGPTSDLLTFFLSHFRIPTSKFLQPLGNFPMFEFLKDYSRLVRRSVAKPCRSTFIIFKK